MLEDVAQHRRAVAEIKRLEALVRDGTATDVDRARLKEGHLELLCWGWEDEWENTGPMTPREASPAITRDPRATRFVDWWELNRSKHPDKHWFNLFGYWTEPFDLSDSERFELWEDVSAEYHEREPEGMVITDYENIPDAEAA